MIAPTASMWRASISSAAAAIRTGSQAIAAWAAKIADSAS